MLTSGAVTGTGTILVPVPTATRFELWQPMDKPFK